eukprot:CAMPEP_0206040662 /NCGR_PEP_ID=MMETSP1466-20131121/5510_1 /ASSEMBLY_ACC=CAM_ASM_001126 /TAXON_ID=44452 /ORGANISM="Pavlova gyrans, Strain CCMP608" /LENGTH=358 /DNA_ID=CAMNT_0053415343 /DNA_START=63 /DNA_END=1136 /DNA_ORIENTATION=+
MADISCEVLSLRCPVTQRRLEQPCRTARCSSHAAAFCARSLSSLTRTGKQAKCPICCCAFDVDADVELDAQLTRFICDNMDAETASSIQGHRGHVVLQTGAHTGDKAGAGGEGVEAASVDVLPTQPDAATSCLVATRAAENTSDHRPTHAAAGMLYAPRFIPASEPWNRDSMDVTAAVAPEAHVGDHHPRRAVHDDDVADFYASLTERGSVPEPAEGTPPAPRARVCDVCGEAVTGDMRMHQATMAHQFALNVGQTRRSTTIPCGNVGYRMMRDNLGWAEGQGLGRHGQGVLKPVATRLKRDRTGVRVLGSEGSKRMPLRVTHGPKEVMGLTLADTSARPESKAEARQRRKAEKRRDA